MAVNHGGRPPRAVIHKRILESAASRPDASVEELAEDLAGASPELVERVLDEYGDPAEGAEPAASSGDQPTDGVDTGVAPAPPDNGMEPADTGPDVAGDAACAAPDDNADTNDDGPAPEQGQAEAATDAGSTDPDVAPPAPPELTEKQRRALRAIAEHPDATQAELADRLGVSSATVNKRVNAVEGFDWADRQAFVERLFGPLDEVTGDDATTAAQPTASTETPVAPTASDGGQLLDADTERAVEQLQERVARLEGQVGGDAGGSGPTLDDAELLAKVVRAVVADDAITAEEELRVLETLLDRPESA